MIVYISDEQSSLKIDLLQIQQVVKQVIHEEGQTCEEVNIYFIEPAAMCELHEQYFGDPSQTDCISFPIDEEGTPYRVLGEVFVCPATALTYATQHSIDPYEETLLYLVHGLLHLMGYDDVEETDRALMRQSEARHMQLIKTKIPFH